MNRVSLQHPGGGPQVLAANLRRIEHGEMAVHTGLTAGNPRHQTFAAAAKSGEIMETHGAGDDQPISFHRPPIDHHRQTAFALPQINQLLRIITVMIIYGNPPGKRPEDLPVLSCRLPAMNTQGHQNADLLIRNPDAVQFLNQNRQKNLAAAVTGYVRDDNHHRFLRLDNLGQGWSPQRLL